MRGKYLPATINILQHQSLNLSFQINTRCTTTTTSPSFPQIVYCTLFVFSRLPISSHSSPPLFYPSLRRCFQSPSETPILRSFRAISTVDYIEPIQISRMVDWLTVKKESSVPRLILFCYN
ncbi:hypothetical protein Peur_057161 [Populus x canadensis]